MRWWSSFALCLVVLVRAEGSALAAEGALIVSPAATVVKHPRFPQTILVSRQFADGTFQDLTRESKFVSADANIARVDGQGRIYPVGAGQTMITVTSGDQTATVAVTSQPIPEPPVSYSHEVQPILSQARCNQGACHGYSLGKNGFKLSLRGADPEFDYLSITKEFYGRRVNRSRPQDSVLLTKPAGDAPHGGGVRLPTKADGYRRLAQWISEGSPSDYGQEPKLTGIDVTPAYRVLAKPGSQQLQVIAKYSDGSTRDVTQHTIFDSGNEDRATVDKHGIVTFAARGEAAIQVRYERVIIAARLVALESTPGFAWSAPPERNFIDTHVFSKLRDLRMNPSELCSDAEYLRRVSLDLTGVQAAPEEVRAFLADTSTDKRDRIVEELFKREEHVDHWSLKWGDLLQNSRRNVSEESMYAFRDWLRGQVAANSPLDKFARDILTGDGAVRDQATAAYYRVSNDPKISMERSAQVFTGIRMLCARCHSHPFENWTQADYYGMTTFFNQVSEKVDFLEPTEKLIVVNPAVGFALNPRSNKPQPPRFLGGGEPAIPPNVDRRIAFADWLTSKTNPFFARSLVNRYWSYFMGRGIIDPVDDIRISNPPINAPLLDGLTKDFVEHNFDARHLMRTIVQSRVYQLSSKTNPSNVQDLENFSHALPRRLTAEQLLDSMASATGVPETLPGAPGGFRASQGPDTNVVSEFLDLFGRAPRMEACECDRTSDTNMLQALHMINGDTLLRRIANPGGRVARLAADQKLTPAQRIEELYLATLGRPPTAEEAQVSLKHVTAAAANSADPYQDLMWALLNSSDFLFVN